MSKISFQFKNDPATESVPCPGSGMTLINLKKAIIAHKNLDENSEGVDLVVENAQNGHRYTKDGELVPRHSLVTVKLVPRYREYRHSVSRYDKRVQEAPVAMRKSDWADDAVMEEHIPGLGPGRDADQGPAEYWSGSGLRSDELNSLQSQIPNLATQRMMAYQQASASSSDITPAAAAGQRRYRRPIPREKAKAIYNTKLNRPHGIPVSMLKQVSVEEAEKQEGKTIRQADEQTMVTVKQDASRFHEVKRQLGASAASIEKVRAMLSPNDVPIELRCALCNKLLKDAVTIPRSERATCRECAEREIMSNGFKSPFNPAVPVTVEDLTPATNIRGAVAQFVRNATRDEEVEEEENGDAENEDATAEGHADSAAGENTNGAAAADGLEEDEFGGDIFAVEATVTPAETAKPEAAEGDGATSEDADHAAKRQKLETEAPPQSTQAPSQAQQPPHSAGMPMNGMFMPQMMMPGYGMPMPMMGYPMNMMGMNPMMAQRMMMRGNMMYGNRGMGRGHAQQQRPAAGSEDGNGAPQRQDGRDMPRQRRSPSPKPEKDPLRGRLMTKEEYRKLKEEEGGRSPPPRARDARADDRDRRSSRERSPRARSRERKSRERSPVRGGREQRRSRERSPVARGRQHRSRSRDRRPSRERDEVRGRHRERRAERHGYRNRRENDREERRRSRSRDRSSSRRKEKKHKRHKKERKRKHRDERE